MEQYTRPYTEEEKANLRRRKHGLWEQLELFFMKWVFINFIVLAPFLLYERFVEEVPPETEGPIVIVLVVLSVAITFYLMNRLGEIGWNKAIENELKTGEVLVTKLKTDKVLKRKDPEDFGSGFYLKIDDNRTLYLEGQYLDDLQYDRKFPNTEMEIIQSKWNEELMEIISSGSYLKPERKLKAFTEEQYKSGSRHFCGDIIETPIDEIK